jgi:hypothetical protein
MCRAWNSARKGLHSAHEVESLACEAFFLAGRAWKCVRGVDMGVREDSCVARRAWMLVRGALRCAGEGFCSAGRAFDSERGALDLHGAAGDVVRTGSRGHGEGRIAMRALEWGGGAVAFVGRAVCLGVGKGWSSGMVSSNLPSYSSLLMDNLSGYASCCAINCS